MRAVKLVLMGSLICIPLGYVGFAQEANNRHYGVHRPPLSEIVITFPARESGDESEMWVFCDPWIAIQIVKMEVDGVPVTPEANTSGMPQTDGRKILVPKGTQFSYALKAEKLEFWEPEFHQKRWRVGQHLRLIRIWYHIRYPLGRKSALMYTQSVTLSKHSGLPKLPDGIDGAIVPQ